MQYEAFYRWGKNKYWSSDFDANNIQHARHLAKEFIKKDNIGCPKSERGILTKVREKQPDLNK